MGVSPRLFLGLFQTACAPVVRVLLLCGTGAWLARIKVLTPEVSKGLNHIVFVLLLPCLIFSNLASAIDADKFILWWYMPINVLLCCLVGAALGYALAKVCRIPRTFVPLIIATCCIGNLGNLPLVLIDGICNDRHASVFPGSVSSCLERGVAYVSYGMWPATFVMWTYVYWLLAPPKATKATEGTERGYVVLERREALDQLDRVVFEEADVEASFPSGTPPAAITFDALHTGSADPRTSTINQAKLRPEVQPSIVNDPRRVGPHLPPLGPELPAGREDLSPPPPPGVIGGVALSSRISSRRNSASGDDLSEGGSGSGSAPRPAARLFKELDTKHAARKDAEATMLLPLSNGSRYQILEVDGGEGGRRRGRMVLDVVVEKGRRIWKRIVGGVNWKVIFTPPVIAVFVAMGVGMCPGAKDFMFGPTAPVKILTDTINMLAEAMIPCMMLVLGGNLASGPGHSEFGMTGLVGVGVTRLVLLPLLGIAIVFTADRFGILPPSDHMFRFVLMLQFAMPSAINIGTVAALHNHLEKEASLILFWQYISSAVTTTFFVLLFLFVLTVYD